MNHDEPIAYFITWTVYGTFLQGDTRGWRKRREGEHPPRPFLAQWHRNRLKHSIELLGNAQQAAVDVEIERLARSRDWHVWATNVRTNHVHVVVSATVYAGRTVCDQLKANCTRVLRERCPQLADRPVWTVGGDWQCINTEEDLAPVILYVSEAQDRMGFDDRKQRR